MSATEPTFDERLRRLTRKHRRMAENGVARRMGPDGLIIEYPRRRLPRFPWRAVAILVATGFLFKAWMFATLGAAEYDARLAQFDGGGAADRAAAWLLQADPATVAAGAWLAGL